MKNDILIENPLEDVKLEELFGINNAEIILFNDDVNSFDHVIETLMNVCDHHSLQAEQCAMIVHNNGKCGVKTGTYDDLKPLCSQLLDAGLSAEVQ